MKYWFIAIFALTLPIAAAASPATSPPAEDFEHGVSKAWTTEGLGPQPDAGTIETPQEGSGNHFLRISTDGSFYSIGIDSPFDPAQYPRLSWRWRIDRMPTHADIANRGGDDAAARLYVVFKDAPPANGKVLHKLEYVWDTSHPVGSIIPDPYAPDTTKAIVLESGNARLAQWVREEVDLVSDYQRAFGARPGWVKTIAFASDSNETHSASASDFDDLQISAARAPSSADKSKP
jgi:hypothetical protein